MRRRLVLAPLSAALFLSLTAVAQPVLAQQTPATQTPPDSQTLADIRQQLSVVYVEIQKLKREMSTTGAPSSLDTSGTQLDRINALEEEVRNLTNRTEELEHRVDNVVKDGTNRLGDLEYQLVQLEGGDVSKLGKTTTLGAAPAKGSDSNPGGNLAQADKTVANVEDGGTDDNSDQLAMGEKSDFEAAQKLLTSGDYAGAIKGFNSFKTDYPGSPLAPAADLGRGRALEEQGQTKVAARAYLDSFSQAPQAQTAPVALFRLGRLLGKLGQKKEACTTLAEVSRRFPNSPASGQAQTEAQSQGCQ